MALCKSAPSSQTVPRTVQRKQCIRCLGQKSPADRSHLTWPGVRKPVALRHVDSSTGPMSVALRSCTYHSWIDRGTRANRWERR